MRLHAMRRAAAPRTAWGMGTTPLPASPARPARAALLDMPAGMENASTGTVSSRLESPQRLPAPPLRVPLRTAHSQADSPASFPIELFRLEEIRLWRAVNPETFA